VGADAVHSRVVLVAALALLCAAPLAAQTTGPVYVATYLDVRPASSRQGADLATSYVKATLADAGNRRAEAFQEIGRTNRVVIIEAWADQASQVAHEKAAHTVEFRERLKAIHRSPYDQRIHTGFAIDPMPMPAGRNAVFAVTHVDVPGARRQDAEALLTRLHQPSLQDAGHLRYDVYQQVDRTNHFTVFAAWSSRSAFDESGGTAHGLQFREALAPMLGALYDERLYQAIQ